MESSLPWDINLRFGRDGADMREQEQRKVSFRGTIKSVQPRSNVWRYRLDNRTHSMTGYNIFLTLYKHLTLDDVLVLEHK